MRPFWAKSTNQKKTKRLIQEYIKENHIDIVVMAMSQKGSDKEGLSTQHKRRLLLELDTPVLAINKQTMLKDFNGILPAGLVEGRQKRA